MTTWLLFFTKYPTTLLLGANGFDSSLAAEEGGGGWSPHYHPPQLPLERAQLLLEHAGRSEHVARVHVLALGHGHRPLG